MTLTKEQLKFVKNTVTKEAFEGALQHEAVMLYLQQLNEKTGTLTPMIDNLAKLQDQFDQAYKNAGRMSHEKYQQLINECKAELQQVKRE
ncbi:hypothetical protein [Alkalicoccobacillus gibsonii]|uniref:hypothetical protein n=1 Tax=Alkalicoccobacillus gibsonii TaxID=79881 RepID=UPI003511CB4B